MKHNVRSVRFGLHALQRSLCVMIVVLLASCATIDQMAQKQCAAHYSFGSSEYNQCIAQEKATIQAQFAEQERDAPFNNFMPLTVVPGVD